MDSLVLGLGPAFAAGLRVMKKITAVALGILILAEGAWAAPASRFFAAAEVFSAGGINDRFEQDTQDAVDAFNSVGVWSSGSTKTTAGLGGRIGGFFANEADYDVAGSVGLILGPQITQVIENGPFTYIPTSTTYNYNGKTKVETNTAFWRFLIEGSRKVRVSDRSYLRLSAGAGVALCYAKQTITTSGSIANVLQSRTTDENWTGVTWELGPTLVIPTDTTELEFGLRYSQLPFKSDEDYGIAAIRWKPISLLLGVRFGANNAIGAGPAPRAAAAPPVTEPPAAPPPPAPPGIKRKSMSIQELNSFFHALPAGTLVSIELNTGNELNVLFDRFDGRNFNLIWCCSEAASCPKGSGTLSLWLQNINSAQKK